MRGAYAFAVFQSRFHSQKTGRKSTSLSVLRDVQSEKNRIRDQSKRVSVEFSALYKTNLKPTACMNAASADALTCLNSARISFRRSSGQPRQ
jgi:hypothetical protein